jgi:hypothetical protein
MAYDATGMAARRCGGVTWRQLKVPFRRLRGCCEQASAGAKWCGLVRGGNLERGIGANVEMGSVHITAIMAASEAVGLTCSKVLAPIRVANSGQHRQRVTVMTGSGSP